MKLRKAVFFPPFLLLFMSAVSSILYPEDFLDTARQANNWILEHFDWLFSWGTFSFLLILILVYVSPIAKTRIGGPEAKPILNRWQWFTITLCTTIATGILFWGTAEPLYHIHSGPEAISDPPRFAMSTMLMHWTITPYGIYTLGGLTFALGYYNYNQPFRVSTLLYPLLGKQAHGPIGDVIDAICLFALVAGMAASLGTGIMSISGGFDRFFNLSDIVPQTTTFGIVGLLIVISFVISASTGLQKGIRILSDINIKLFIALAVFVFIAGPTVQMLSLGINGGIDFFTNFLPRSVGLDADIDATWSRSWTVFYWANWLAWTPVSVLFLGRLAVGYTVRDFIHYNLIFPAIFSGFWMVIFSGSTIYFDQLHDQALHQSLTQDGPQAVVYQLFEYLPMGGLVSIMMLGIIFISFVTAADSNTSAMTGMSVKGISPDNPEAPLGIKVLWGSMIGLISWIMISFAGIDGIRMMSNLGGFPALFLVILVGVGLVKLTFAGKGK